MGILSKLCKLLKHSIAGLILISIAQMSEAQDFRAEVAELSSEIVKAHLDGRSVKFELQNTADRFLQLKAERFGLSPEELVQMSIHNFEASLKFLKPSGMTPFPEHASFGSTRERQWASVPFRVDAVAVATGETLSFCESYFFYEDNSALFYWSTYLNGSELALPREIELMNQSFPDLASVPFSRTKSVCEE